MASTPLLSKLGSYFTPNDGYRHAIVSTSDGEIHEIFFNPRTGKGNATLAHFCGVRFLTAFFTPDDGYQHPIVATETGDIFEIFYKPHDVHVTGSIATFANIVALSGFYAADDNMRILHVAQTDGSLHEVFYKPSVGVHISRPALANFSGLQHVASFYSGDDKYRHAIVATSDGNITEVFYHPTIGVHISHPPLANFSNIVGLAAFYAEDDRMRIVVVATADGLIHEIFYRPDIGVHITRPALATIPRVIGITAFFSSDDKLRHVIAADANGNVTEIFYSPAIGIHISAPSLATFAFPSPSVEMVGPDLTNLTSEGTAIVADSSPAGRCVAIDGTAARLYTMSETGGVWSSAGGAWSLQSGSPAPANLFSSFTLAVSRTSVLHVVAGNDLGLWETTNGGASWMKLTDPATLRRVTSVAFDDTDRLFAGVSDGVIARPSAGMPFQHTNLGATVTAISISDNKVWARVAASLFVSADHGSTWSPPFAIPSLFTTRAKDLNAIAATDDFAYLVGTLPAETGSACGGDNVLLIFNAATSAWTQQRVLSSDIKAWHIARGEAPDSHTCDGTGDDSSIDGRRFVKSIRLHDTTLPNVVGKRIQIIYGGGQEVWRARGQNSDGTITDWNWAVGTHGPGYSNRDPVHGDIWDFHVDLSIGGRTAWALGDGGVYAATVGGGDYEFSGATWVPAMAGLHTHQINSLTLLQNNPISRPRIVYAIGDSGAFYRDTSFVAMPDAPWNSYPSLGDGNSTAGDSSSPLFAQMVRNLTTEAFLRFGTAPFSAWVINPKTTPFIDPAIPTRLRFLGAPWQEGQFAHADVIMMVDLPLVEFGTDIPFATQPGPSSGGLPVLIRNQTFDINPDINAVSAKGKGWTLERSSLPPGSEGFAVSGDRSLPVYYVFTSNTLFAERAGKWVQILGKLVYSQTFGPVFPNPYDARIVYALTRDKGVQVSSDAGSTWAPDPRLNAVVGPDPSVVNQISFNYSRPSSVAVCTERGQVLIGSGSTWSDLTPALPLPLIPIRSVAIDCEAIYLGTFGRGLMRIVHYS